MDDAATTTYRRVDGMHSLEGLSRSVQAFVRAIDSIRYELRVEAGLSATELRALARIAESPGLNPKALADFLEVSMPAVTAVTNGLVARGLLVRGDHPHDRRRVALNLTPGGHELIESVFRRFDQSILRAAVGLPLDTTEAMSTGLTHVGTGIAKTG